jgi:hypothetical protein
MRGPDPDMELEVENARLERIITGLVNRGGYHEGTESTLLKWILGVLSTLCVGAIVAGIVVYSDVQILKTEYAQQTARMEHIEKIIEPRYRNGESQ